MRLTTSVYATTLIAFARPLLAQTPHLDVYFIDTEGGQATLIVTPARESILIDSGNPGERDAHRIYDVAVKTAKLHQIDHIIATHWHLDHYGGTGELAKLIPIKNFYDHGIPDKSIDDLDNFPGLIAAYRTASKGQSTTLRAGSTITLKQTKGTGRIGLLTLVGMQTTIPDQLRAKANPYASEFVPHPKDNSDNANSLGFALKFGIWRFLDLGDLTWNIEEKLVDPTDKIGKVDVYLTTHHGLEVSNNPVLLKTVSPTVAIFNNGPTKGGHPDVTKTLRSIPNIKGIWQLHRNINCPPDMNTEADKIANIDADCKAEFIKLSVDQNGKFYSVQIGNHGKPVRYMTRSSNK